MSQLLKPKSDRPLRLALLGDARAGKSTFIQQLTLRSFTETYYPTLKSTPILFEYAAGTAPSKMMLNEYADQHEFGAVAADPRLVVGRNVLDTVGANSSTPGAPHPHHHRSSSARASKKMKKNGVYSVVFADAHGSAVAAAGGPASATLPATLPATDHFQITPILLELIDTPPFDPRQIVPFLEASMDIKLPADILHNLANEPRRDHSAKPLIVASGAQDLNGNMDGYFFVYSSIPSLNPPGYNDSAAVETRSPLEDLKEMKQILDEAWAEYTSYKRGWEIGGEGDVFSFVYSVKSLWKKQAAAKAKRLNSQDYFKPPVLVVCTHCDSDLRSPTLIAQGKELAKSWGCGFIEMDNLSADDVDLATSMLIREIIEDKHHRQ